MYAPSQLSIHFGTIPPEDSFSSAKVTRNNLDGGFSRSLGPQVHLTWSDEQDEQEKIYLYDRSSQSLD